MREERAKDSAGFWASGFLWSAPNPINIGVSALWAAKIELRVGHLILDLIWSDLDHFWTTFGSLWGSHGASLGLKNVFLARARAYFLKKFAFSWSISFRASFWSLLDALWATLGRLWGLLGVSWGLYGVPSEHSRGLHGVPLGAFWIF